MPSISGVGYAATITIKLLTMINHSMHINCPLCKCDVLLIKVQKHTKLWNFQPSNNAPLGIFAGNSKKIHAEGHTLQCLFWKLCGIAVVFYLNYDRGWGKWGLKWSISQK